MSRIKMDKFGGMLPAWGDRLLPEGQAANAQNCYLFSGELVGWRKPKFLRNLLNASARMVYRVPTITQGFAGAYFVFLNQPNNLDNVKLGEETYTFVTAAPDPALYQVFIGATATDTAQNLFGAFTAGTGTYSTAIVVNPAISAADSTLSTHDFGSGAKPVIFTRAPDFGAAFNTTAVLTSAAVRVLVLYDLVSTTHNTTTFQGGLNQSFDRDIAGTATWLEFEDQDTDVMRSPVVNDTFGRYYYASPSLPPMYNTYDRIVNGDHAWLLGVPQPGCSPVVSVTGGGNEATLGWPTATVSGVTDTIPANSVMFMKIVPDGAMQLNSVSFMPKADNIAGRFAAVLYDGDNAGPTTLITFGAVEIGWTTDVEALAPFANPPPLLAGSTYWMGIMIDSDLTLEVADMANESAYVSNPFTNGPPAVVGVVTFTKNWHLWANLTTSSVLAARAYTYTFVSAYDEEGPPAEPTIVTGWSNGTWTIGLFEPPPDELGVTRNLTKINIYRTISNETGLTTYFLVAQVTIGTATYVDILGDDVVSLNLQLQSTLWSPPPEGMVGLMSMPNGMAVGFKGNELWFAEPFRPHAWPPSYVLTTEFPIVGIGVVGNSVVAATSGNPYIATGSAPSLMSLQKVLVPEPCIARGSILSTSDAVFYMSPNGLIRMSQAGAAVNTTELWITREKWRLNVPQNNSARSILLASSYFSYGSAKDGDTAEAQRGYTIELSAEDANSFSIFPQPGGHRLGFNKMVAPDDLDVVNVQVDPWTGIGLMIQNGKVLYWDFSDTSPTLMVYKWKSKIFQDRSRKNFEAMKVFFDVPPGTPTQSATRNEADTDDASWDTLAADQYGIIRVYGDGVLVTTREVRTSGELLRILSGFKVENWQWEFEGRVSISNVQVATSVRELGNV